MNRNERRAGLSFARRTANEWHPFELVPVATTHPERWADMRANTGDLRQCWRNNVYSVQVYARTDSLHPGQLRALQLAVRRHDGDEVRGWSDLQRIKDEIAGPDRVAIEIYPPADSVVDNANMRHIFVLPAGTFAPFSIQGRWE